MARVSNKRILYCSMNGHKVGTLELSMGTMSFKYCNAWINTPGSRAISRSIEMVKYKQASDKVHAYFENLLPDNIAIREHIADELRAKSKKPFDLLEAIGHDCVGALAFTSEPPNYEAHQQLHLELLDEKGVSAIIKKTRIENMLGMDEHDDFRISIAGAQEKTALTLHNGQWHKPIGVTPTTHIFKPPIHQHEQMRINMSNSVDNEWFCLKVCSELGLPTAVADIMQFDDQKVLVVERFDRRIDSDMIVRLPQEDMCQALGKASGSKYEDKGGPSAKAIMELLKLSKNSLEDREHFFLAQMVFWLLAAIDGHAKNFSIFLEADGYRLTPLYDVISAYPYFGQGNVQKQKIKMAMKVQSKNTYYHWNSILKRHWFNHAKALGLDEKFVKDSMGMLLDKLGQVLTNVCNGAPDTFDAQVGEDISKNALKALKRFH
jgi:serine/threonine-protein kinase HipA